MRIEIFIYHNVKTKILELRPPPPTAVEMRASSCSLASFLGGWKTLLVVGTGLHQGLSVFTVVIFLQTLVMERPVSLAIGRF